MNAGAAAGSSVAQRRDLLEKLIPLARAAGAVILDVYATDFAVRGKVDASPVTEADEKAEAVILRGLAALAPDIPVVSEEAASAGQVPASSERSGSSIRSTAPRNSSVAMASSRSISR